LDLFSGIGGFSYGLELASSKFKTVQFVEVNEYCRRIIQLRWPGVPVHDDIKTFTARPGEYDLVTAGWPCQPWSKAGKQLGAEDDRDLWPEVRRLIKAARPQWFLGENVRAIVEAPMGLDRCLSDLEDIGYDTRAFIVPALGVDARHIRDRLFVTACRMADARAPGLPLPQQGKLPVAQRDEERRTAPQPHWWPAEPNVCRVAYGLPRRVDRLRSLGNSVVPQVVAQFGRAIIGAGE